MKGFHPAFENAQTTSKVWLPDMDLNHDKQIQSLLCYRYTIGQTGRDKVAAPGTESRLDRASKRLSRARNCRLLAADADQRIFSPEPAPLYAI
jgi:hypothetical protein